MAAVEHTDDRELMLASLEDPALFQVIFDRYHSMIFSYLAGRVGAEAAADLASEVFLAAFRQRASFRDDAISARPWLYGIAANLARRHHRSAARRRRAYMRAPVSSVVWIDPDSALRVDAARQIQRLTAELSSLRSKDREVLLLYALADLSYSEIAEALDIPVGTVRSRLSRTRTRLRNLLPGEGQSVDDGIETDGGGE